MTETSRLKKVVISIQTILSSALSRKIIKLDCKWRESRSSQIIVLEKMTRGGKSSCVMIVWEIKYEKKGKKVKRDNLDDEEKGHLNKRTTKEKEKSLITWTTMRTKS